MKQELAHHYTESIIYALEQTVTYTRIKGAQVFNELNIGITIDQFTTLDAIYCNGDICQRDLSKIILKDRSNTGRLLNILEKNGFITRELETKGNRPVKKIYITKKGKEVIEEYQPKLRGAFKHFFDEVSDEELTALRNTLEKLKQGLSKTTNIQI